jgi:hypothetical protein
VFLDSLKRSLGPLLGLTRPNPVIRENAALMAHPSGVPWEETSRFGGCDMKSTYGGGRSGSRLLSILLVVGYSWLATGLRAFTIPVDVAVGVPTLILLGLSWHRSRLGRVEADRPPRSSLMVWAALLGALALWELIAYVASPRQDHPTLSSISDDITSGHPARAVVFALWLVLGLHLFARGASPEKTHA